VKLLKSEIQNLFWKALSTRIQKHHYQQSLYRIRRKNHSVYSCAVTFLHLLIRRQAADSIRDARSRQTTAEQLNRIWNKKILNLKVSTKYLVTTPSIFRMENTNRSMKCTTFVKFLMMKAKKQQQKTVKHFQKQKNSMMIKPGNPTFGLPGIFVQLKRSDYLDVGFHNIHTKIPRSHEQGDLTN